MSETTTDTAAETSTEATEAETKERAQTDPMDKDPSSTHASLAKYISENTDVDLSPRQAQAVLVLHSVWQGSPERKAERDAEKVAKAQEAELKKQEADKRKAEKAAEAAKKAEEKKAKDAAKAAEAKDDDSDLDTTDNSDDSGDSAGGAPRRRRRKPATETATAEA